MRMFSFGEDYNRAFAISRRWWTKIAGCFRVFVDFLHSEDEDADFCYSLRVTMHAIFGTNLRFR